MAVNYDLIPPSEIDINNSSIEDTESFEAVPSGVYSPDTIENVTDEYVANVEAPQGDHITQTESDNESDEVKVAIRSFCDLAGCDYETAKGYLEVLSK